MHTLFVRLHNRIEGIIGRLNPDLSREDRFQHTRRFVIALWQKIVFGEFARVILGDEEHKAFELRAEDGVYNASLDGRIDNEFATAAFRLGHTYVPDNLPFQSRDLTLDPENRKLSDVS